MYKTNFELVFHLVRVFIKNNNKIVSRSKTSKYNFINKITFVWGKKYICLKYTWFINYKDFLFSFKAFLSLNLRSTFRIQ